jgi:hypothetical protein
MFFALDRQIILLQKREPRVFKQSELRFKRAASVNGEKEAKERIIKKSKIRIMVCN